MRKISKAIVAAGFVAMAVTPVLADGGIKDCTTEPQASWKPAAEAEAKATAAGYTVNRSKIAGTCYEVYGVDAAGKLFELFYHPISLEHLATVAK